VPDDDFSPKKFADSENLPTFADGNHKKKEKDKGSGLGSRDSSFFSRSAQKEGVTCLSHHAAL